MSDTLDVLIFASAYLSGVVCGVNLTKTRTKRRAQSFTFKGNTGADVAKLIKEKLENF